ncbi:MAG: nucleotide exchange factor GrpE [Ruminococcaceae bacterium]|nr:nucleotide exchange factor GrpE [Oscillospiraceae bacterium]
MEEKKKAEEELLEKDPTAGESDPAPGEASAEPEKTEAEGSPAEEPVPEETPDESGRDAEPEPKGRRGEIRKLKKELEETKKSLADAQKKAEEAGDRALRLAAEYDNFRKRTQSEKAGIYADAVSDTLRGLLPIIDNLQYAAKYSGGDAEKVAEGLTMILSKLPETLEKLGIKAFGEAGETFDPALHNAVMHVEDESLGEGVIVEVLQQGYMYGDKVLRYAMVKTAN